MAMINIKLDDDLRDRYKATVALKRTNMREDLIKYIKREVEKKDKKIMSLPWQPGTGWQISDCRPGHI